MKQRIFILAGLVAATMLLTGCLGGGGSGSNSGSAGIGGVDIAGLFGGGGDAGGNEGGGGGGVFGHTPEPATALLLGAGLAAYAIIKRRKLK